MTAPIAATPKRVPLPDDAFTRAGARLSLRALFLATIADTQHEIRRSGSSRVARWRAQALGYGALLRLAVVSPLLIGGNMGRLLATLLLGAAGSGLLAAAFSGTNIGPVHMAPFFLFAVVTPLTLRAFRLGGSYRQMFGACAGVGIIMAATAYSWIVLDPRSAATPLIGHLWRLAFLLAAVLFGSALAAKLAWETLAPTRSVFGQVMGALLVGSGAFAVVSFVAGSWNSHGRLYSILVNASFSVLEAFYFAVLSVVLIVPLLLLARRRVRGPVPLAILAAVLFPLPLVAELLLWRGTREVAGLWNLLAGSPGGFAVRTLPWLLAAVALGWCLAALRVGGRSIAEASE